MAKKKKLTALQSQWSKEISRIKRAIKSMESRGYQVDYTLPERPSRVTKKAITELRSETTHAKLLSRSTYITSDGEIISGYQAETKARKESARKGQLTKLNKRNKQKTKSYKEYQQAKEKQRLKEKTLPRFSTRVLENLRSQLKSWSSGYESSLSSIKSNSAWKNLLMLKIQLSTVLLDLLDSKVAQEGERRVALRLETNASIINEALEIFVLDSDENRVQDASVRIATIINGASLSKEESEYLTSSTDSFEFPD